MQGFFRSNVFQKVTCENMTREYVIVNENINENIIVRSLVKLNQIMYHSKKHFKHHSVVLAPHIKVMLKVKLESDFVFYELDQNLCGTPTEIVHVGVNVMMVFIFNATFCFLFRLNKFM